MTIEVNPFSGGSGGGDVNGPGSSTTNGVARWANSSGTLLKNSSFTVSDAGEAVSPTLTVSRVLVSGAGKEIQSSSVTTTTLGYLDATSSIQTQLDAKIPLSSASTFGLTLLSDANAAAGRATLGLGTIATQPETAYALLAGRAGGQTITGGTGSGENLTLQTTSNATKGFILFGTSGTDVYDAVNRRFGFGVAAPTEKLEILSGNLKVSPSGSGSNGALYVEAGLSTCVNIIARRYDNGTTASRNIALQANGNFVGVGTLSPSVKLHVINTAEQLRVGYDTSNYFSLNVSSTGAATLQCVGSGKSIILSEALDISTGTTTGSKIGTATTQKIGFYNATPIVQRSGSAQDAVVTTTATQTTPWGYSTQAQADAIITLVNELRAWAVAQGFIKGSA